MPNSSTPYLELYILFCCVYGWQSRLIHSIAHRDQAIEVRTLDRMLLRLSTHHLQTIAQSGLAKAVAFR